MSTIEAGYREIEHTADWELEIWAPDLKGLLKKAAQGMYALSGVELKSGPRQERSFTLEATDPESLLVTFLSELLFFSEHENLGFDDIALEMEDDSLKAVLSGTPLLSQEKEIKAVTYHNLNIKKGPRGLEVRIVFDV